MEFTATKLATTNALNRKGNIPLILLLVFLSGINALAQGFKLEGAVTDASKQGIPGITVVCHSDHSHSITDMNGRYSLSLKNDTATVTFIGIGYQPVSHFIRFKGEPKQEFDVTLKNNTYAFNTVVVSAGKFEQKLQEVVVSMEVLKPELLENTNQTTMETAVEKANGVVVIDGQANIRGGSGFSYGAGSRVLVLVDDIPMLAGDAGDVKWSFLPVENISQVEVVKGASSALYGSSALNGVIHLRTKYPGEKPETKVTLFGGAYDAPADKQKKWWGKDPQLIGGLQFSHLGKYGNSDLVIGGQSFQDDGYREGEKEERLRIHASLNQHFQKIKGLTAGISIMSQESKGGNFLLWQNDSSGALRPLGGIGGSGSTLSLYTTTRTAIDPTIVYTGKKWSHRLKARYFLTNNKNNTNQEAKSSLLYGEYLLQWSPIENLKWSFGTNLTSTEVNGDLYGSKDATGFALYSQLDYRIGKLNLSGGLRNESARQAGVSFDPKQLFRAGASYALFKGTQIRASWGQGFRFPSLAEKFIRTAVGSIVIYPNDTLKTESGWSAEFGIRQGFKWREWSGMVDVACFQTEYKDMMEFTFGSWGDPSNDPLFGLGFKSLNVGNARITGFEASIGLSGKIGLVNQLLQVGATLINPTQLDFDPALDTLKNSSTSNVLKYRYKTLFKFDGESTYRRFSLGYSVRYTSFMENIDRVFQELIPGVKDYRAAHEEGDWIVDSQLAYAISPETKINFVVKNLFNREYMGRPADMQAPRSFVLQLMLSGF